MARSTVTANNYSRSAAITPSDTVSLAAVCDAILVAAAGNISAVDVAGGSIAITAAPVGILPLNLSRVNATGTTATVYALYFV